MLKARGRWVGGERCRNYIDSCIIHGEGVELHLKQCKTWKNFQMITMSNASKLYINPPLKLNEMRFIRKLRTYSTIL